jgi:hypothetical protein
MTAKTSSTVDLTIASGADSTAITKGAATNKQHAAKKYIAGFIAHSPLQLKLRSSAQAACQIQLMK